MLSQIATLLIDVVAGTLVYLFLARFHFQWLRVPFRNPLGEFVIAATNWAVLPARRVIPGLGGIDLATPLLAWLTQLGAICALALVRPDEPLAAAGFALPAFALLALVDLLRCSVHILVFAVLLQVILSWVNPYSPIAPVVSAITRRFLRPLRSVVPPIANFDLSPLVLLLLLQIALIPLAYLRALVETLP